MTKKFKKALNKFVQHICAMSQERRAKMDLEKHITVIKLAKMDLEKHITLIKLQDQLLIHLIQV
jgi:hypothetical protein